jgi:hypothetical protein
MPRADVGLELRRGRPAQRVELGDLGAARLVERGDVLLWGGGTGDVRQRNAR